MLLGKREKGRLGAPPSVSHILIGSVSREQSDCLSGLASYNCKSWQEVTVTSGRSGSLRPEAEIGQSGGKPQKGTTVMYLVLVAVYLTIWSMTLNNRSLQASSSSESYTHMHCNTT